jgi:hypothetical protein
MTEQDQAKARAITDAALDSVVLLTPEWWQERIASALAQERREAVEACVAVLAEDIPDADPWWRGDESERSYYLRKLRALEPPRVTPEGA